jgi:hypothetical protein
MPIVSLRSTPYTLPSAAEDIGEVYSALVQGLPDISVTNLQNEGDHVHGDSGGVSLSVTFLFNSGRQFWQVIATAEDSDSASADDLMGKVESVIQNLTFL